MDPADGPDVRRIVHDLRSPLHAVLGFIDLARLDNTDPAVAAHLDRAAGSAQHLAALIAELDHLDAVRHDPAAVDMALPELIEGVCAELRVVHGDTHPIAVGWPGDDALVTADAHLLRRVLTNLIGNALGHTPVGTPVAVTVGEATTTTDRCRRDIVVEDSGPGFDPDAPTERLGLLLVGELLQRMGGTLDIGHPPGGGTRAVISLPAPCPPM
jgi:signal transduction histidine kinase